MTDDLCIDKLLAQVHSIQPISSFAPTNEPVHKIFCYKTPLVRFEVILAILDQITAITL